MSLCVYQSFLRFIARDPLRHQHQSLIFVRSLNDVDDVVAFLWEKFPGSKGSNTIRGFHGQMDDEIKQETLELFGSLKTRVLVATLASFAAGMDYPNVRAVYLLSIPESVEQFWNAAGRAGRDGEKAVVYLYASVRNMAKALAESRNAYSTRIILRSYGVSISCRLKETLGYIGGFSSASKKCGHCDLCQNRSEFEVSTSIHNLLTSVQNSIGSSKLLGPVAKEFDADIIRAALESGGLCVSFGAKSHSSLILTVSGDDATQRRLLPTCTNPLLIYQAKKTTHENKRQRTGSVN